MSLTEPITAKSRYSQILHREIHSWWRPDGQIPKCNVTYYFWRTTILSLPLLNRGRATECFAKCPSTWRPGTGGSAQATTKSCSTNTTQSKALLRITQPFLNHFQLFLNRKSSLASLNSNLSSSHGINCFMQRATTTFRGWTIITVLGIPSINSKGICTSSVFSLPPSREKIQW